MGKPEPSGIDFVLLLPVFAGAWCAVCLLGSALSGWRRLAASFPASGPPSGMRFSRQSGRVGFLSYNRCLTIDTSSRGLRLSIFFLFRLGHPPILIPWEALRATAVHRLFGAETVAIEVGSPVIATLRLPRRVLEGRELAG